MNNDVPIEVKGLGVTYDGHSVLRGVDLAVRHGEFVSLVGRSGSGKSTLLLALAGLVPHHGQARVDGKIGMVFQNNSVFPHLTVSGNIAFGLHGLRKAEKSEVVRRHLELVGLADHARKYPAQLSGGQVQRVAVAMALARDPSVTFMDEPFSALDSETREQMQSWLLDIHEKKRKTTLFVTHSIDEALYLSDRVLVLDGGRIDADFVVPFVRPRAEETRFVPDFVRLKRTILDRLKSC